MNPTIIISDFIRWQGELMANDENGKQHVISESDFKKYLDRNFLLDAQLIYNDASTGEYREHEYKIELEDYFATDESEILLDLSGFLESKAAGKSITRIINNITSTFKKAI